MNWNTYIKLFFLVFPTFKPHHRNLTVLTIIVRLPRIKILLIIYNLEEKKRVKRIVNYYERDSKIMILTTVITTCTFVLGNISLKIYRANCLKPPISIFTAKIKWISSASDPDPVRSVFYWLSRILIRILYTVQDPAT